MATMSFTACSAMDNYAPAGSNESDKSYSLNPSATPMPMPGETATADGSYGFYSDVEAPRNSTVNTPEVINFSEKIIYSVWAEIETRNFDETLAKIDALINNHGAFIENSNEKGVTYSHSGQSYRYAYFQIRVPSNQLSAVRNSLGSLGNVVSRSDNATNVTSQFIDTEARRNSLLVQEERILDMLSKVENLSDLILLEQHLSSIRYQIESLTSTLNQWQNQVDYSTLTLNINEVEEFTEFVPIHRTYWEQMGDGIMATLRGIGNFFTSIFMWVVVSAPVLIILIGIALITFIIIRAKLRVYKKNRKERPAAQYYPPAYPAPVQESPAQEPVNIEE